MTGSARGTSMQRARDGYDFFRSGGSQLDEVEKRLVAMLRDRRTVFDASAEAVFGGGKSPKTKKTVKGTAHVMNLMTSLFVPLDQLDSYDEAVDDRI